MKSIQDEILVIIPYVNSGQGHELELSLTGWNMFCKSRFRLIVIGDYNECIKGKAEFIEMPRVQEAPGQYLPNIDVARKLDYIYERFHNEYDHFVLANDDEYPIRDFTWEFLAKVWFLQPSFIGNRTLPCNYWAHDMAKTRLVLDKEMKGHINFCNHHPFYFNMEMFHDMSIKFNLANDSMIRENLYYNYYKVPNSGNVNSIRYGQWDQRLDGARIALRNPNIRFICNSTAGWSKKLEELIRAHYDRYLPRIESIEKSDKIIVSFTSWKKRIQNCAHTVDLMKNQTLRPDKIILNLSTDEFPKKEEELPKELIEKQDDVFEIYWVKENTKVYKKIIPTLNRFPNDIIISIDDDIEYPNNSIESLYNKYLESSKNNPITAGTWDWEDNIASHLGALTLFTKEMFGDYLNDLYENVVLKNGLDIIPFDDAIFTYSALLNNRKYIKSNNPNCLDLVKISPEHKKNRILHNLKDTYKNTLNNEHKILRDYIKNKYNKTYQDLIKESTDDFQYPLGISICISAWNTAEYIEECLDSVANQTWFKDHDNWEILLGIDGCEKTLAKVKEIMYKYKNLRVMMMDHNVGTYVTCNTIMKEAKYGWLMRFDSDDIMNPDMIEKIFSNDLSNCDAVRYSFTNFMKDIKTGLAYGSHMIKKSVFNYYGGYRSWRIAADFEFFYRIEPFIKVKKIPEVIYNRRVRDTGLQYSPSTKFGSKQRNEYHKYIKEKSRKNFKNSIETITFTIIR